MLGIVQGIPPTFSDVEPIENNPETPQAPSHDCLYEFSLEHWMEVYLLVQEECLLAEIADGDGAGWHQFLIEEPNSITDLPQRRAG